jgi:hypothetical protein
MIDLIDIAKRIFRPEYWEYRYGAKGEDKDGDYMAETDCSWLVSRVLKTKFNIPYLNTATLNSFWADKYFDPMSISEVRRGDLIVFWDPKKGGHVGFIEEIHYDSNLGKYVGKMFHIDRYRFHPYTDDFIFDPSLDYSGIWYGDIQNPITRFLRPKENCDHNFDRPAIKNKVMELFGSAAVAAVGPSWSWIPIVMDLDGDGVETTSVNNGSF